MFITFKFHSPTSCCSILKPNHGDPASKTSHDRNRL